MLPLKVEQLSITSWDFICLHDGSGLVPVYFLYCDSPLEIHPEGGRSYAGGFIEATSSRPVRQVTDTQPHIVLRQPRRWGAWAGGNGFGVSIFLYYNKCKQREEELGLDGDDLLRLGLERGRDCEEAIQSLAELIGEYGVTTPNGQSPAFIICDANKIYTMNTAGRRWAARPLDTSKPINKQLLTGKDYEQADRTTKLSEGRRGLHFAKEYGLSAGRAAYQGQLAKLLATTAKDGHRWPGIDRLADLTRAMQRKVLRKKTAAGLWISEHGSTPLYWSASGGSGFPVLATPFCVDPNVELGLPADTLGPPPKAPSVFDKRAQEAGMLERQIESKTNELRSVQNPPTRAYARLCNEALLRVAQVREEWHQTG